MNKRLKYEKYKGLNNIITFDLHNGYTVNAISAFQKETNVNEVELFLKENTIDRWELIEDAGHLIFNVTEKPIYSTILKWIATHLTEGFFDKYIDRYEYEILCFDNAIKTIETGVS